MRYPVACLAVLLASCTTVHEKHTGVDVRFVISMQTKTATGSDRRTYENGVLMSPGKTFQRNLDQQFNVLLHPEVRGETVSVEYRFDDLHFGSIVIGQGTVTVPMNGAADVDLGETQGRHYTVHFIVHERELPRA